ncbi:MAG: YkvA family protein [Clostridiaceae bacterium]
MIKDKVKIIKKDLYAIYLAYKHKKTPLYTKILCFLVVGFALSPIDVIPDFIPILGYLDDIILIPLGIMLAVKIIPKDIMAECRIKAENLELTQKNWIIGILIIIFWVFIIYFIYKWLTK